MPRVRRCALGPGPECPGAATYAGLCTLLRAGQPMGGEGRSAPLVLPCPPIECSSVEAAKAAPHRIRAGTLTGAMAHVHMCARSGLQLIRRSIYDYVGRAATDRDMGRWRILALSSEIRHRLHAYETPPVSQPVACRATKRPPRPRHRRTGAQAPRARRTEVTLVCAQVTLVRVWGSHLFVWRPFRVRALGCAADGPVGSSPPWRACTCGCLLLQLGWEGINAAQYSRLFVGV